MLEAHGVVKTVGTGRARRRVLDGAGLSVEAGELLAITGRSGSGKSTLLHLLGGLDRPDAGEIWVGGAALAGASAAALARVRLRHIGYVFQSFQLIPELSGMENVLMPARLPGAPRGATGRAGELVEALGLGELRANLPHELSGGEQQRFAIARALVNDPDVILADEPTGNLDGASAAVVLELLAQISRGPRGCAVVIVTHEPASAAAADRVVHLSGGRLHAGAAAASGPAA